VAKIGRYTVTSGSIVAAVSDRAAITVPAAVVGGTNVTVATSGNTIVISSTGSGGSGLTASPPYLLSGSTYYWASPLYQVTLPSLNTWTAQTSGSGDTVTQITTGGAEGIAVAGGGSKYDWYSTPITGSSGIITAMLGSCLSGYANYNQCNLGVFSATGAGYFFQVYWNSTTLAVAASMSTGGWGSSTSIGVNNTNVQLTFPLWVKFTSTGGSSIFSSTSTCAVYLSENGTDWQFLDSRTCPASETLFAFGTQGQVQMPSETILYSLQMQ
jgi:hypothetical protein